MNELEQVRARLTPQECALLETPEVRRLPPGEQLAYLRTNRRIGFLTTAFAGGVRVVLLAGGALAMIAHALAARFGDRPFGGLELAAAIGGTGLLTWTAWMTPALARRLKALRAPL